ncbi:MAG: ribonuclease R [Erysipelotrichaceae bacterium]|nr:ribonuclease R [Erysipelotrichaceae bacterium]
MRETILRVFRKEGIPLSFAWLREKLPVKEEKELHRAIDQLLKEGVLFLTPEQELALKENYTCGLITLRHNGSAFVTDEEDLQHTFEVRDFRAFHLLSRDRVLAEEKSGRILQVLERRTQRLSGIVRKKGHEYSFWPDIYLPKGYRVVNWRQMHPKDQSLVICRISSYEKEELEIEEVLGDSRSLDAAVRAVCMLEGVRTFFPEEVLKEADSFMDPAVEDYPDYRDLRDIYAVTIDGDDAKDFDDAVSLQKEEKNYRLRVHIADVSSYVTENSILDREALDRGTSVYFPGQVIPMLPEALSNGLCSLNPGEERLTLTCELLFNERGERLSYKFYPAVIVSHKRLTYNAVNVFLQGEGVFADEELEGMLKEMAALAKILQKRSHERGNIDFRQAEKAISVTGGRVVDVRPREHGEAEELIESFMIEANCAAAETCEKNGIPALYRVHQSPNSEKLEDFCKAVEEQGYLFEKPVSALTARDLSDCLEHFRKEGNEEVFSGQLLRCMAKAHYDSRCQGHYALSREYYCHFTSPIRRYPDLFVHRMLKKYLFAHQPQRSKDEKRAEEYGLLCSQKEERAVETERTVEDLMCARYMSDKVGKEYEGVISGITSFGIFVQLPNTIEGMIPLRNLPGYYSLRSDGTLSDGENTYRLGQKMRIIVEGVDLSRRTIDLYPVTERREDYGRKRRQC